MRSRLCARATSAALAVAVLASGWVAVASGAAANAAASDPSCVIDDATITWGFKETFRSYISGAIANGAWTVSGGAEYETPNFRFPAGTGEVDPALDAGAIEFAGAITFTGHGDILNTTIGNPVIEFRSDGASLLADVTGTTQDGEAVDERAVEFVTLDLDGAVGTERSSGNLSITGIPATLTDAGASAFGTYRAGEPFDAVTLDVEFAGECAEPAGAGWVPWVAAGLGLAVVGSLALVFRRRSPAGSGLG